MPDAVTRALDALRAMIATGQLPPGGRLTQVGLASQIGISTTPLREALRRLEAEGWLEWQQNGRPRVRNFDPGELDALYASRVLLESLGIAQSAPRLSTEQLAVAQRHLEGMRGAGDPAAWDDAHASFHLALMAAAGAPLRDELERLLARSDRYRRMSVWIDDSDGRRAGDEEHAAILAACQAGDGPQAAVRLARHLTRSALTLIAHLEPGYDPAAVRGAVQIVMGWASG